MLKNEDYLFQNLSKMNIEFPKYLKNEDLKIPVKIVKKMNKLRASILQRGPSGKCLPVLNSC